MIANNKVSFCGFAKFIKQKCISKYYATLFGSSLNCFYSFFTILTIVFGVFVGVCLLAYGIILLFSTLGKIESITNLCGLMACITAEHNNRNSHNQIFVIFLQAREKNQCCSCNVTSKTYNNYNLFVNSEHSVNYNYCDSDGYVDYILTGIKSSLFLTIICLICCIIFVLSKSIYNFIRTAWEEYLDKKNDLSVCSVTREKCIRHNINNIDIIYQNDIELGKTHFQTDNFINKDEDENNNNNEIQYEDENNNNEYKHINKIQDGIEDNENNENNEIQDEDEYKHTNKIQDGNENNENNEDNEDIDCVLINVCDVKEYSAIR